MFTWLDITPVAISDEQLEGKQRMIITGGNKLKHLRKCLFHLPAQDCQLLDIW